MSAFLVDKETIDKIITYLTRQYSGRVSLPASFESVADTGLNVAHNANVLGARLWDMNQDALKARYGDAKRELNYRFKPVGATDIEVYKAVGCLLYQCSEGLVPETDLYKELEEFSNSLAHHLARSAPGYDQAPWG